MKSDEILIKTFDQVKNDNFDQVKFDQVIVCQRINVTNYFFFCVKFSFLSFVNFVRNFSLVL
jgi:hypothetical protein